MKTITGTAIAAALILTLPACNQQPAAEGNAPAATEAAADLSALAGTWKADLATLKFEQKPDEYLLQGGTWKCSTCIPPVSIAADGQFHPVADAPYYDSASVKAVDDRTVEIQRRKGDKDASSITMQVSADGTVLTNKFHDATVTPAIDGTATAKRAGPAPQGAHAVSGQWMPDRLADFPEEGLNLTYAVDGNTVTSTFQGQTYKAELGGPPVAIQGDIGGTMVAVAREGANGLKETFTRDGKEVGNTVLVPSADGRSVAVTYTDVRDGAKTMWTGNKTS
jgi:hypothetical protein